MFLLENSTLASSSSSLGFGILFSIFKLIFSFSLSELSDELLLELTLDKLNELSTTSFFGIVREVFKSIPFIVSFDAFFFILLNVGVCFVTTGLIDLLPLGILLFPLCRYFNGLGDIVFLLGVSLPELVLELTEELSELVLFLPADFIGWLTLFINPTKLAFGFSVKSSLLL